MGWGENVPMITHVPSPHNLTPVHLGRLWGRRRQSSDRRGASCFSPEVRKNEEKDVEGSEVYTRTPHRVRRHRGRTSTVSYSPSHPEDVVPRLKYVLKQSSYSPLFQRIVCLVFSVSLWTDRYACRTTTSRFVESINPFYLCTHVRGCTHFPLR